MWKLLFLFFKLNISYEDIVLSGHVPSHPLIAQVTMMDQPGHIFVTYLVSRR